MTVTLGDLIEFAAFYFFIWIFCVVPFIVYYWWEDHKDKKKMNNTEKQFCEELQKLLDRYKTKLEVPTIMQNAQYIFHHTLSIRYHPELHPYATEKDYLAKFITEGPQAKIKWQSVDEFHDMKEKGEL